MKKVSYSNYKFLDVLILKMFFNYLKGFKD
jgi:hypothetical protein